LIDRDQTRDPLVLRPFGKQVSIAGPWRVNDAKTLGHVRPPARAGGVFVAKNEAGKFITMIQTKDIVIMPRALLSRKVASAGPKRDQDA
jgi:hypothetical protein